MNNFIVTISFYCLIYNYIIVCLHLFDKNNHNQCLLDEKYVIFDDIIESVIYDNNDSFLIKNIVLDCKSNFNFTNKQFDLIMENITLKIGDNSTLAASNIIINHSNVTIGDNIYIYANVLKYNQSTITFGYLPKFDTDYIRTFESTINNKEEENKKPEVRVLNVKTTVNNKFRSFLARSTKRK